jgi:hypothetical protein
MRRCGNGHQKKEHNRYPHSGLTWQLQLFKG